MPLREIAIRSAGRGDFSHPLPSRRAAAVTNASICARESSPPSRFVWITSPGRMEDMTTFHHKSTKGHKEDRERRDRSLSYTIPTFDFLFARVIIILLGFFVA